MRRARVRWLTSPYRLQSAEQHCKLRIHTLEGMLWTVLIYRRHLATDLVAQHCRSAWKIQEQGSKHLPSTGPARRELD